MLTGLRRPVVQNKRELCVPLSNGTGWKTGGEERERKKRESGREKKRCYVRCLDRKLTSYVKMKKRRNKNTIYNIDHLNREKR